MGPRFILVIAKFTGHNLPICQEAFHVLVQPDQEFVQRWAVTENTTTGLAGEPGDGTTVDLDEPFILRLGGQSSLMLCFLSFSSF